MRNRPVTLTWPGKEAALNEEVNVGRPVTELRTVDGRGRFFQGDNLQVLTDVGRTEPETVTLAYLDPPFLTNRVHEAKTPGAKTLSSSGAPRERETRAAFDDRWLDRASYLESIARRIQCIWHLLAPHGSMVLHVDPKTSHYLKVICDEIFGEEAFASEIIWRYRRWPSKTPNFQRVHDVLLRYRKDPSTPPRFNQPYEPLAPSTLATWGSKKQRAVFDKSGHRLRSSQSEEETQGVPMGDVWDIGVIAPISRERTGYPSQKPEALLERLISALSNPGEIVLDPYAGSGTTLAVAARLGRSFIGIDESPVSHEILLPRLENAGISLVKAPHAKTA